MLRLTRSKAIKSRRAALQLLRNHIISVPEVSRLRVHEPTKAYVARRTAEGHRKLGIIRCLKRYLAREVFYLLRSTPGPDCRVA